MNKYLKFLIVGITYIVILYLMVAWIAHDIDIRWWWDWQRAIWITACFCLLACLWDKIIINNE